MGRPNAGPKQQFQSVSQSPSEAIVDENQQESAGNEQLEVPRGQNGQNNQQQSHLQPHQATTAMAFPPQNYQMRSPIAGADSQAFTPQPQAFPPTQDEPQSFIPRKPQAFPPFQEEPQAFPPSQDEPQSFFPPPHPQAFPPIQEEPQAFPPSQHGKPQEFPPKVDDHHHHQPQVFPPAPDEPQAFPPNDDYHQPQAFPPAQDDPQPFPPPEASQNPQAFPPQQAAFQQQQQQNGMQFPQNANFFHPSTMGGGQMGAQSTMPASPFHPTSQSMINNATPGFSAINQNHTIQVPTENWKSGLFECMNDPTNALVTACFPCVTFGQIAEIIDSGQTSCGTSGLLYGTIAFCIAMPCLMSCTYRTKLRSRYGLIETPAPDWIIHCFCECCALCQEYRELKERGTDPSIGWIGNVAKQKQMVQNAAMTPPMMQTMMGR